MSVRPIRRRGSSVNLKSLALSCVNGADAPRLAWGKMRTVLWRHGQKLTWMAPRQPIPSVRIVPVTRSPVKSPPHDPRAKLSASRRSVNRPACAPGWDLLGIAYTLEGRPGIGVRLIEKAIAIDPSAAIFYMHLGKSYMDLTDYERACEAYEEALGLGVERAKVHFDLGLLAERQDRLQDAIGHFEDAIEVSAAFDDPYYRLGAAHESSETKRPPTTHVRQISPFADGIGSFCNGADKPG